MSYQFGDIVLVNIPDPDGLTMTSNHPAMIVHGPRGNQAVVLGITASFDEPIGPLEIRMPWAPGGHAVTGLYKDCVMKCYWIHQIDTRMIVRLMGHAPLGVARDAVDKANTHIMEKERLAKLADRTRPAGPEAT